MATRLKNTLIKIQNVEAINKNLESPTLYLGLRKETPKKTESNVNVFEQVGLMANVPRKSQSLNDKWCIKTLITSSSYITDQKNEAQ